MLVAGVSAVATALIVVVAINVLSAEHKTEQPLSSLYGVDDPGFARAAGVLFGPPLVPGNDVRPLYNGRQIFAAMLEDIRHAQKERHLRNLYLLVR